MMKTKSYTIHTQDETKVQLSETVDHSAIVLQIIGPSQRVSLNHDEFAELCGMKYDLKCEKVYDSELSQVPDLSVNEDTPLDLPTDQLKREIENG
jgi:hypothetical protein